VLILRAGPKLDGESVILFRNLDDPRKYRSENLNFFGISQADEIQISAEHWEELVGRLRRDKSPWGPLPRQYGFLEANYRGHSWVWQHFHPEGQRRSGKVKPDGTVIIDPTTGKPRFDPSQYFLIEGKTEDNKDHLPTDYLQSMMAMPEIWKKRHVYGSWEELGGLVYEEFNKNTHIVPGIWVNGQWVRDVPREWNRYRGLDHGTRNPTVCLYAAVSPSGTVYIYDEYYRPGSLAKVHATDIKKRHPNEHFKYSVIDPSAFNKEGTSGESPAMQYFDAGIPVVKAPENAPFNGINIVKRWMTDKDPQTGRPKLLFVQGRCPNLINEIGEYIWDELGPTRRQKRNEPDRPRKKNDHAMDALRYLMVSRPQATPEKQEEVSFEDSEWVRGMPRVKAYDEFWEP
jgi:hypothetical protein